MQITYSDIDGDLRLLSSNSCSNGFNGSSIAASIAKLQTRLKFINAGVLPSSQVAHNWSNPAYLLNTDPTVDQGSIAANTAFWVPFINEINYWVIQLFAGTGNPDYVPVRGTAGAGTPQISWLNTQFHTGGIIVDNDPQVYVYTTAPFSTAAVANNCTALLAANDAINSNLDLLYAVARGDNYAASSQSFSQLFIQGKVASIGSSDLMMFTIADVRACCTAGLASVAYGAFGTESQYIAAPATSCTLPPLFNNYPISTIGKGIDTNTVRCIMFLEKGMLATDTFMIQNTATQVKVYLKLGRAVGGDVLGTLSKPTAAIAYNVWAEWALAGLSIGVDTTPIVTNSDVITPATITEVASWVVEAAASAQAPIANSRALSTFMLSYFKAPFAP